MGNTFGNVKFLLHLSAVALITVPAWATDDESSILTQEGCTISAREVVDQFIDLFYVKKEVRLAFETWVHPDYVQHKSSLPDGREAVIVFLEKLLENQLWCMKMISNPATRNLRKPDEERLAQQAESDSAVQVHYR